ncbi:Protein casc1 [Borealophlyctis nickersoniae]|nr:Protein casc1 [Borealophlyctis nickersoniae]
MPPSKPATAKDKKGGKGKKKSKKELERERELAEQQRLAEEARLAELRAKKERELREQKEREALEQLFMQAQGRLDEEREEVRRVCDTKAAELTIAETAIRQQSELPAAEELCAHLEQHICASTPDPQTPPSQSSTLSAHLRRLRAIINDNWDQATAQILQYVDYFHREPNENFQLSDATKGFAFGVWGNLIKNPRYKTIEFPHHSMSSSLPKPLALASVAIRMLYQSGHTAAAPFEHVQTGQHMSVVGGVLFFDLVEMPDPPKSVDNWTIRQILSPTGTLRRLTYPFKKPPTETNDEDTDMSSSPATALPPGTTPVTASVSVGGGGAGGDTAVWPMTVTFSTGPGTFIRTQAATVKWWNEETKGWDADGIEGVEIDLENGLAKFRTIHFAPTAIVQNTYAELPYQDWTLRPVSHNRASLSIVGRLGDIEILIGEGECRLVKPVSEAVEGGWMAPGILFKRLSEIGLNFRGPRSMRGVDIEGLILKNPQSEEACITGISLCAPCFAFRKSPANRSLASSKCVFQVLEVIGEGEGTVVSDETMGEGSGGEEQQVGPPAPAEGVAEEASASEKKANVGPWPPAENAQWTTVLFDVNWTITTPPQRSGFVVPPGDELTDDYRFSAENAAGHTVHATVYHLLRPLLTHPVNSGKIEAASPSFTRTVVDVLKITRVLCLS